MHVSKKTPIIHLVYGKSSTPLIIPARLSCSQDKEITDGTTGWFQAAAPKLLSLLPRTDSPSPPIPNKMSPKEKKPWQSSWTVRQSYKKGRDGSEEQKFQSPGKLWACYRPGWGFLCQPAAPPQSRITESGIYRAWKSPLSPTIPPSPAPTSVPSTSKLIYFSK